MGKLENGRVAGIDIVKSLAILFVVCVHFSLNTKYYTTPIGNFNMLVQTFIRWIFVTCVPLFVLATGFLSHKKTVSRGYYLKILRVIIPYVLISVICLLVRSLRGTDAFTIKSGVYAVFSFTADPYAWYVNMFIGLYLLAPFFNAMLSALDRRKHLFLIFLLAGLICLPLTFDPVFANYPRLAFVYFPDFWQSVYPLVYYAIGAYIARYRPAADKKLCFAAVVIMALLQTLLLYIAQPHLKNNWFLTDYGSIFVLAESVALFLLLYDADVRHKAARGIFRHVSTVTLEIYLFSYLADSTLYPYLAKLANLPQEQIFKRYFLLAVPAVFLSALLAASLFHVIYDAVSKRLRRASDSDRKKSKETVQV